MNVIPSSDDYGLLVLIRTSRRGSCVLTLRRAAAAHSSLHVGPGIAVSTCTPTRVLMLHCVARLPVCSVWAAPLAQSVPSAVLFSSLLGGGRGLPQLPPLYRCFGRCVFPWLGVCRCLVWLSALVSAVGTLGWMCCCCCSQREAAGLAAELMQPRCSSALLNRCCGDEGASQMVAAHHVVYWLPYWR